MSDSRTIAEELQAAATRLQNLVAAFREEERTNRYWDLGWAVGTENAMGGASGHLAAALGPGAAESCVVLLGAVANFLDDYPDLERRHVDGEPCGSHACRIMHAAREVACVLGEGRQP